MSGCFTQQALLLAVPVPVPVPVPVRVVMRARVRIRVRYRVREMGGVSVRSPIWVVEELWDIRPGTVFPERTFSLRGRGLSETVLIAASYAVAPVSRVRFSNQASRSLRL